MSESRINGITGLHGKRECEENKICEIHSSVPICDSDIKGTWREIKVNTKEGGGLSAGQAGTEFVIQL